jgi:hypothetical protein
LFSLPDAQKDKHDSFSVKKGALYFFLHLALLARIVRAAFQHPEPVSISALSVNQAAEKSQPACKPTNSLSQHFFLLSRSFSLFLHHFLTKLPHISSRKD